MIRYLIVIAIVLLTIYAVVEVAQAARYRVRNLPRWLWSFVVICVPVVGPILWFGWGRPLAHGRSRPVAPDDDDDFLRGIR